MAKTRRTKIIIEETLGENKDTKVFVNGELYQELEDDTNQSKAKKKTTSSKKAPSKAKSSTKSKSAKAKKDSNSKTTNTKSKNKTTKSNKKTTTKKKSTKSKKKNDTKEVKDKNIIDLPLIDESKEIENKESTSNKSEKEGTSASFLDEKQEIVEIKDASIVPLNNEISELKSNDNKKEIIENVEIIDPKKEEIVEKEEEKKLDVLEAKVIKKEDLEKDKQNNTDEEKTKEEVKEETETEKSTQEQEKESSIAEEKSKETTKNDDFAFVNEVNKNLKEDSTSTPSKANITVVKENKAQDKKENKSFLAFLTSKKGLVIGASLLAILLVVLVPVTLYYQKVNSPFIRLEEIKEEEIDKTKFKTSESFINDLTNFSFDFEDFNNNYLTSFNYSNSNDVYCYENSLTTKYGSATSNETKETVSFNGETNSYTLTTSTLEDNVETFKNTTEIKSDEVKNNVRDYLSSFYSDYLYLESTFVKNYLDVAKEKYELKYYYIRENESYRIMLGDETFVLAFNKYGLVTNMKVGITGSKKVSQTANFTSPIPLYYSIDATYEF